MVLPRFAYTAIAGQPRLTEVDLVAADPSTDDMTPIAVAAYDYTSSGQLADEYDPRISPALKTAYTYDASNRLLTLTPPGQAPWTLHYDSDGKLGSVSRPDPSGATATTTIVYGLPLSGASGSGLPDVTGVAASHWDETSDLPVAGSGTAIFPATHPPAGATFSTVLPSDWPYASISYLDVNGRDVNDATYGDGDWQISTTRYDTNGDEVWDLSPGNRAQALNPTTDTDPHVAATTDSADRADLLATTSTYDTDGNLTNELGPMHPVTLADGTIVDGQIDTVTSYDQGAPNGDDQVITNTDGSTTDLGAYGLPTSLTTSVIDSLSVSHDPQTTHTGYDPVVAGDPSGWDLGQATSSTDPGGLTTYTRYNADGITVEQRLPGDANGTGPRTTDSTYYTATGSGPCVNAAEAGLLCQTTSAGQPTTGDPLPVTTYAYDRYGDVTTKTETYGIGSSAVTRTATTGYDGAGRATSSSVTVSPASAGGTAVPTVTYGYDPTTGLPTTASAGSGSSLQTLTTRYDDLGRPTSYTDAAGNTSTTGYDLDGRVTSVDDGKGTTSYTYDSSTEHRGLVTSEDIGIATVPSTFTASYDPDGNLSSETYPNGLVAMTSVDNVGEVTDLDYAMSGTDWLDFTQAFNGAGEVVEQSSPQSSQSFGYDGSDRLTTIQDTTADPATGDTVCITRVYGFDDDSDRTSLASYPDAGDDPTDGDCTTATTPVTTSYSYDTADRLTSDTAGNYSYDALGRTTSLPAGDASGIGSHAQITGDASIGYYTNDMVNTETQGGVTDSFTLDPDQDRINTQVDGSTTTTNHYSNDTDSPTWTATDSGWTRNLADVVGSLAATETQDGAVELDLADPHGDIIATVTDALTATSPDSYSETTEYGIPRDASTTYDTYGWLGTDQRSTNDLAGLTLMGVRLYNPTTGRFLSTDPVNGGNANAYIYPDDPLSQEDPTGEFNIWSLISSYSWYYRSYSKTVKILFYHHRITYHREAGIRFTLTRSVTHELASKPVQTSGYVLSAAAFVVGLFSAPAGTILGAISLELGYILLSASYADSEGHALTISISAQEWFGAPWVGWALCSW